VSRRRAMASTAPIAVASDGGVLVNASQLGTETNLEAVVGYARASGLEVFVGVVVPARHRRWFLLGVDDAAADIVGRLGPKLTGAAASSASGRAAAGERRGHLGRRAGGPRHPRRRPA